MVGSREIGCKVLTKWFSLYRKRKREESAQVAPMTKCMTVISLAHAGNEACIPHGPGDHERH